MSNGIASQDILDVCLNNELTGSKLDLLNVLTNNWEKISFIRSYRFWEVSLNFGYFNEHCLSCKDLGLCKSKRQTPK